MRERHPITMRKPSEQVLRPGVPAEPTIEVVGSGLTRVEEEKIYQKVKNEGKCCEGGEEGWTG